MAEPEEKTSEEKPAGDKKTTKKAAEPKKNTIKVQIVDSAGTEITITGACSNKEIHSIRTSMRHIKGRKFEVKKQS